MSADSPTQHLFGEASFIALLRALEASVERRVRQEADHDRQMAEAHADYQRLQDAHHALDAEHSELVMKTEALAAREKLDRQMLHDATAMVTELGYMPSIAWESGRWVVDVSHAYPSGHPLNGEEVGLVRASHSDIRVAITEAMRKALQASTGERTS